MTITTTDLDGRRKESRQRPYRSAVTWSDAEQACLEQLMRRLGFHKDARMLRRILLDRCRAEGIDTRAVEDGRYAAPQQVMRRQAA